MEARTTASPADGFWIHAVSLIATHGISTFLDQSSSNLSRLNLWIIFVGVVLIVGGAALLCWACPGGPAWGCLRRRCTIPGPRGWPLLGSLVDMGGQAHRRLAELSRQYNALSLMAFSLGSTRVIITSSPDVAKELLSSPAFADRPLKQSAQQLLFGRAIGFAPYGEYWRKLRRIAATHLFAPKRIAAHEKSRQAETGAMMAAMASHAKLNNGVVQVRYFLQKAALNIIMITVFGKRFSFDSECQESRELQSMVREGFDLLGAFNMADHLPFVQRIDPQRIQQRCAALVHRVNAFVQKIINDHKCKAREDDDSSDFVDVLLSLQKKEKLSDGDIVAILWEMIFRGTDTMTILTEWILAEMILNPDVQLKVQAELDSVVGRGRGISDADVSKMTYFHAVVKETLRLHPPGPLLSWARLATTDVNLAGHLIPAGTTAMVNMWSITHDPAIWSDPNKFIPERYVESEGGADVDIRGNDLRLAPFGAGRRVCPGRALGMSTVHMWLARMLDSFHWSEDPQTPVDLAEELKLSCEMVTPLSACIISRH